MSALPALSASNLAGAPGVRHGFFTRLGGVSERVYASLNVGLGSKDDAAAVAENRRRVAAHFGAEPDRLLSCYQIHSAVALAADGPWSGRPEGDAVVTRTPGLVCGALAADCAPVLLADPEARVVAAAHAGWKGALGGIVESTVAAMQALGARPDRIVAAVGPCIGPDSYEVGLEFLERFTAEDASAMRFFRPGVAADKRRFDLPAYVLGRLARAGVEGAEWTGHDTCADEARFFSNRRAFRRGEPDYGRLISCIALV
jgi:YfiH family protein